MSLTLGLKQNQVSTSDSYGKWYPRVKYGKIVDIEGLAAHIHDHHAIYPEDLVRGVLQCAARCTRELMLEGYPVKFDGLGIFKASAENVHGFSRPAAANLIIGGKDEAGRSIGIQAIKMVCQATAQFSRKELTESCVLQWSDLAEKIIGEDKKLAETGGGSSDTPQGGDSQGGGSQDGDSGSGDSSQGGGTPGAGD